LEEIVEYRERMPVEWANKTCGKLDHNGEGRGYMY
jgi:hypothetical protein